ncbi:MAG: adenylate/guanylate cyclase domain-containing protein [Nevskia sp.]|nr:adenylate/guanylate cyclase domain-containing protein [Nevskia sp.]
MPKGIWIRVGISVVLLMAFIAQISGKFGHNVLDELEAISYDTRLLLTLPNTVDKRIVILDIDEKSLAAEGQFPWSRGKLALLVRQLFDKYDVRVLGFDVDFAESDRTSAGGLLDTLAQGPLSDLPGFAERLPKLREQFDYDREFAAALAGKPVVMGVFFKPRVPEGEQAETGSLCAPLIGADTRKQLDIDFFHAPGFGGNVPELQAAAVHCGFFDNPSVDEDGIFRRVPLMQEYNGRIYPSLALAMAQLALDNPPVSLEFDPPDVRNSLHLERVHLGKVSAPVDGQVAVYVPYRGQQYSFPYVSATDVIHGTADPALLKGAIVIMGTTSAGLLDLRSTPVQKAYAGVEVHANIISGLLDGRIKQKAPYYVGIEAVLFVVIAILMTLLYPRLSPLAGTLLVVGVIAALIGLALFAWSEGNFIMPLGIPVVFTLALFLLQMLYGFFVESRGKREITKLFGDYVPPEVVEELALNPESVSMEGEIREMTVLFTDVRGFTTISEKLEAKELSELMNQFLTPLTGVIRQHRGTIDKYMGDAIMAFWGAPLEDAEHGQHALQAALEMVRILRTLDEPFAKRGWPALHIGVGLNSGQMRVGNMGSDFRRAYTVMGDAVNLGSRLEGLTKKYHVEVICSESTRAKAPDWAFRELDLVKVKGKHEPVAIFEPLGPRDRVDETVRQDLLRMRAGLRAYRAKRWDEAEREFFGLSQSGRPHPIYELYLERIAEHRIHPPPEDWDGATAFDTK